MTKTTNKNVGTTKPVVPTTEEKASTQLAIQTPTKSVAELIEEQKQFFENKNGILKKLRVFESRAETLQDALTGIKEEYEENPDDAFEKKPYEITMLLQEGSVHLCKITTPVIIKSILVATLAEIEVNRKKLELELLAK